MDRQLQRLIASTRRVLADCALRNGAIVAANSHKPYYPTEAKDYRFVWPRDAMYVCLAARRLGMDIHEKYFRWLMKAEGWEKTGLFYENYHVDGRKARAHFQPDQTGSVLITLHDRFSGDPEGFAPFARLVRKSADGLCRVWGTDHFPVATQDLWEERLAFPDQKESFVYSLAACACGLYCAYDLLKERQWLTAARQMEQRLLRVKGYFPRSVGRFGDARIDASALALVWPFGIVGAKDPRMRRTVSMIEERLRKGGGIMRYEGDSYDGWMHRKATDRKKGAGSWPLLTLLMATYWQEAGDRKKAMRYFTTVLRDAKGSPYLPEQVFGNDVQEGVCPLAWSHAMLVLAAERLGLL
ncbi:glycoside hydrolase family 15 protein [Candidatus Woesearchaeota archaeon]|nr:glycoside hydrolase family 15 protein [Candidatus Woesearchaeota archaeon]